jgi:SAM-dependent methyltransferase
MPERGPFEGVARIVRFNWPFYAAAGAVLALAIPVVVLAPANAWRWAGTAAAGGALWFLVGSLGASHAVYDRSDLHRGAWIDDALGGALPGRAAICHCGYDEISELLRAKLPSAEVVVLDHYDEATMSEPSIRRARRMAPPAADTVAAGFAAWPTEPGRFGAVFGVLAIHELRSHRERAAWFSEARRCLAPGGRVVLVEHLRDAANFAAFGPGFVHFHGAATWRRAWESAGFQCRGSFRITPFVRGFVLYRHD